MINIPYGKQTVSKTDIKEVTKVLESDFLTQGPVVPNFEQSIVDYTGVNFAVASSSATASLHLAYLALDIQPGDIVWTSPNTFVSTANAALYCGAKIDFVDIDHETFNMCPKKLTEKLEEADRIGKLPKIVVPVHIAGQSCDMIKISTLSKTYGFKIVEDASHAIGGEFLERKVGSCEFSDITVFSFHPVKIITTGEGGVATTNDKQLADKMRLLRSHGITKNPTLMRNEVPGPWYYEQIDLGFNYRMTDICAALGRSQMCKIEKFVTSRNSIANTYSVNLKNSSLISPKINKNNLSSFHLYVIKLPENTSKEKHQIFFEALRGEGIQVNLHYMPVYLQPYYQDLGFSKGLCPEAEAYATKAISIPIYPRLKKSEQSYVIKKLKELENTIL